MRLDFHSVWIFAVLLCMLRLSALLMLTPLLQAFGLPQRIRAALVLALAAALVSSAHLAPQVQPSDLGQLISLSLREVLLGASMGFGVFAAFAAYSFAGHALDLQIGFSIANIIDPLSRARSSLIATLFGMVALALFFTLELHHLLLRGLAYSFERVPLGAPWSLPAPETMVRQFGSLFTFGLLLAAAPMFCLFLADIALAVVSRNLPQLNVFILGMPIKIALGLLVLAYSANQFGQVSAKVFGAMFSFWEGVL